MQKAAKKDPEKARANSRVIKSPASATLQIIPPAYRRHISGRRVSDSQAAGPNRRRSVWPPALMQSGSPSGQLLNKPKSPPTASQGCVPPELPSSRGGGAGRRHPSLHMLLLQPVPAHPIPRIPAPQGKESRGEHPALHGLPELRLSCARSSLQFGSAATSLACPKKEGFARRGELGEKSNVHIFT